MPCSSICFIHQQTFRHVVNQVILKMEECLSLMVAIQQYTLAMMATLLMGHDLYSVSQESGVALHQLVSRFHEQYLRSVSLVLVTDLVDFNEFVCV